MTLLSCPRQTRTWPHYWRTALSAWRLVSLWFGECVSGMTGDLVGKDMWDISSRFASVTVNLGPTFLSGALAANAGAVMDEPSCPLVQVTSELHHSILRRYYDNDVTVRGPTDTMSSMPSGSLSICSVSCWPSFTWGNSTRTSPRRISRLWGFTDCFLSRLKLRMRSR